MDDLNTASSSRRKVRYTPKAPPRRKPKPVEPATDLVDRDKDDADRKSQQALLRRVKEQFGRQRPKEEKKTPVQVAFSQAAGSATTLRTFGPPKEWNKGFGSKGSAISDEQILASSSSTGKDGDERNSLGDVDVKKRKDYKEPWDYHHRYYPTTLPLRRPYSGDPELLDEEEFGLNALDLDYDEKTINPASELGLLESTDQERIIFLQLPPKLPLNKVSMRSKGKEIVGSSSSTAEKMSNASRHCGLRDLPQGLMGKMLVYKSGAVKWKIGDIIYDVFPGEKCIFPQDVVAINTIDKNCCVVGEVSKRAVVTPDVDSLLAN